MEKKKDEIRIPKFGFESGKKKKVHWKETETKKEERDSSIIDLFKKLFDWIIIIAINYF